MRSRQDFIVEAFGNTSFEGGFQAGQKLTLPPAILKIHFFLQKKNKKKHRWLDVIHLKRLLMKKNILFDIIVEHKPFIDSSQERPPDMISVAKLIIFNLGN